MARDLSPAVLVLFYYHYTGQTAQLIMPRGLDLSCDQSILKLIDINSTTCGGRAFHSFIVQGKYNCSYRNLF